MWLVSKCGPPVAARTLRWLDAHHFYQRTGISPGHVRFCLARQDKRGHCQDLDLTHFVDDHPQVHAAIRGTVDYQYFFGPQREPVPGYGIHVPTWRHAQARITASLSAAEAQGPRGPRRHDSGPEHHPRPVPASGTSN